MTHASNPANSALLAQSWEISVSATGFGLFVSGLKIPFPGN
jgi:hypothetical protein